MRQDLKTARRDFIEKLSMVNISLIGRHLSPDKDLLYLLEPDYYSVLYENRTAKKWHLMPITDDLFPYGQEPLEGFVSRTAHHDRRCYGFVSLEKSIRRGFRPLGLKRKARGNEVYMPEREAYVAAEIWGL